MVRVEEVFPSSKHTAGINDDEYEDVSDADEILIPKAGETLLERIVALKEIMPLAFRVKTSRLFKSAIRNGKKWLTALGNVAWVFTTTMILIGLPILYAYDREKSTIEYEKEQAKYDVAKK